jgi:hypothetical protein
MFVRININKRGNCSLPQAVSRRPVTPEARVCGRDIPCLICGGQNSTLTRIFSELFGFPMSLSFYRGSPHLCICFIYTSFNDALCSSDYIVYKERMIRELERMWKEAVMA